MNSAEKAIIDLVRLSLREDAGSVRRYATKLLRQTEASWTEDFRDAVAELILNGAALRGRRESKGTDLNKVAAQARKTVALPMIAEPPVLPASVASSIKSLLEERRRIHDLR